MSKLKHSRILVQTCAALTAIACLFSGTAFAGTIRNDLTSAISKDGYLPDQLTVVFSDGPVFFNHPGKKDWLAVTKGMTLINGDALRTGNLGWAVVAFSTDNLLLIKPKSGVRFYIDANNVPKVTAYLDNATVLLSTRDKDGIQLLGRRGVVSLERGEAVMQTNSKAETIKSLHGNTFFRANGADQATRVPEGMSWEFDERGYDSGFSRFDTRMEYEAYRRFKTYLRNFDEVNRETSPEISYKVDSVLINQKFLSHLEADPDGFRIIDPGDGPTPKYVYFRIKLTPYPRTDDHFEAYIDKDLIYPLREGSDGFFEAKIPVPSFPEFTIKVHYIDSLGRRDRVFECRFVFLNKRRKVEDIKAFLQQLSMAFARRDLVFLRDHISREYRDWFGNTYFDFTKLLEDSLRNYRDIRLIFYPHSFIFSRDQVKVNMNFRLSALTGAWNYRYEDVGSDLMTLVLEENEWRVRSKSRGMFLQRLKIIVDPKRGVLKGRVLNEANQMPIQGATVKLLKTRFQTMTDSYGEYLIYNIPPGKYDIEISKNGFGKTTITRVEILPYTERF